jgi:predicted ATPase/DNA-binding winged helix-turn-helix (wHTH) protein
MGDSVSFGQFRMFPAQRRLEKQGVPVKLGARSLDILLALVERAGSVVTKNDLLARVWQDVTVDESALRVHMASLRKALGDGEDGARYLANVSGRGYAFVAEITSADRDSTSLAGVTGPAAEDPGGAPSSSTNLPRNPAPLIGRALELPALERLISQHRLITVSGTGGIGKTRLAIELGLRVAPRFPGGVWLVDLAPLFDPSLVPGITAAALALTLTDPNRAPESIAAVLTEPALLIFDNCEHLIGACAELIEKLLAQIPVLTVVCTSQEILRIADEFVYPLNPLSVPLPNASVASLRNAGYGAVDFFLARAQTAVPGFQLDHQNAIAVAEICRRLEGIPLALEMAAARLPMFGVEGLRARIDEPLRLLKYGEHAIDRRHRTLRQMVERSHDLLDAAERQLFRRLGVFAGSFSLEAAVGVAGAEDDDDWEMMDTLGRLVEKSVVVLESEDGPRYRLLETLRLFAVEKLTESGESEMYAGRHAAFFGALADRIYTAWGQIPEAHWKNLYIPETNNIRLALEWALADQSRRHIAVALAGSASRLLQYALFYEARRYAETAVELIDEQTPPEAAARLLAISASFYRNSDRSLALLLNQRAVEQYRKIGHKNIVDPLIAIGDLFIRMGRHEEAKRVLIEANDMLTDADHQRRWVVHSYLANATRLLGQFDESRHYYERMFEIGKASNRGDLCNSIFGHLAELEFHLGNIDRAIELCREAISSMSGAKWEGYIEAMRGNLSSYLLAQGNLPEARESATAFFAQARVTGGFALRIALMQWGLIAAMVQRFTAAALLMGFVDAGFAGSGEVLEETEKYIHDQLQERLQASLPAAEIEALAMEGGAWSESDAVAFAESRLILA